MAKFGTYDENTSPADGDILASLDVSDTGEDASGKTKRLTLAGLRTFFGNVFAPKASPTFTGTTTTAALTATGDVTVNKSYTQIALNAASAAEPGRILIREGGVTRWQIEKTATGALGFARYSAAGVYQDGPFTLGSDGSVKVPAATAATHAAQVSAIDATTGRLAIGGIEMGDTGWRSVTLENSWGGVLYVRRTGKTVHAYAATNLNGTSASSNIYYTLPSGFTAPFTVYTEVSLSSGSSVATWANSAINSAYRSTNMRYSAIWTTTDAWPTSLPGTAV